jgi:pimeloyl-ACP methyl ester carboxylesterase
MPPAASLVLVHQEDIAMIKKFTLLGIALGSILCASQSRADSSANPLDRASSSFAKLDDLRVHYKSLGTGASALVFVHGWTADINSWRAQVPAFAGKVRTILIDLPGHGQSDKPQIDYTIDLFARAIDAVLSDAGVEKAILVGHSMGTPVIRQFYRSFPKKTQGLVVVDGVLQRLPISEKQLNDFIKRFSGADFKTNYDQFIASMITDRTPPEVRESLKKTLPAAPQYVAASAMKHMFDPSVWKDDPIAVPLLVIMAKSPRWTPAYEAHVRKLAPQVDYRMMDGVGHFLMMEKPEEFNEILGRFVRKEGWMKG